VGVFVTFNYATWIATFPEFAASVPQPLAQAFFDSAALYWRNDGSGPVRVPATQLAILNWLTAHLAKLFAPDAMGNYPASLVGRISSASEGSVSVSVDYPTTNANAWFLQTPYGAAFWQMTAGYRTFRYRAPPKRGGAIGPWGGV
jgi:hypothetical protein